MKDNHIRNMKELEFLYTKLVHTQPFNGDFREWEIAKGFVDIVRGYYDKYMNSKKNDNEELCWLIMMQEKAKEHIGIFFNKHKEITGE